MPPVLRVPSWVAAVASATARIRMNTLATPLPAAAAPTEGIPLRDWFAGQMLAAILVAPKQAGVPRQDPDEMALSAYQYADAMIKARGKR